MKLMRSDRLDAIVAAALYGSLLTAGVSYVLAWERQCQSEWMINTLSQQNRVLLEQVIAAKHQQKQTQL